MTLDRRDLLTHGRVHSKSDTVFANGYISRSINSNRIFVAVLFYGDIRLKGYFDIAEINQVLDGKLGKITVKKLYPK
jgi:hypothetical protein